MTDYPFDVGNKVWILTSRDYKGHAIGKLIEIITTRKLVKGVPENEVKVKVRFTYKNRSDGYSDSDTSEMSLDKALKTIVTSKGEFDDLITQKKIDKKQTQLDTARAKVAKLEIEIGELSNGLNNKTNTFSGTKDAEEEISASNRLSMIDLDGT